MKRKEKLISKLTVFLTAAVMFFMLPCSGFAAEANTAVNQDATGVLQVMLVYTDDDGNEQPVQSGTGFLVNNSTIITCDHVVTLTSEDLAELMEHFGKTEKQFKDKLSIKVTVLRDVTVSAAIKNESAQLDFAILTLEEQIYDRTYLSIRSSASLQKTEPVWALGYPAGSFSDSHTYTSEDVTITDGQVSQLTSLNTVDYVQNSAKLLNGSSGGPLVDVDGNVIGICKGSSSVSGFEDDYFYAVAIDQVTQALNSLGIEYTAVDGSQPTVQPEGEESSAVESTITDPVSPETTADKSQLSAAVSDAQRLEIAEYTEETGAAFSTALGNAQTILANDSATQEQIDQAIRDLSNAQLGLELKQDSFPVIIIIVAVAVVVVIAAVITIIVVMSGKKKKKAGPTSAYSSAHNTPPEMGYQPPFRSETPGTSVLHSGATETTVLNAGATETTVLNGGLGSLTRTKTGERIAINNTDFVIGKERARVSYCITDNTSVSRSHVRISNRGGVSYASDLKSTNGTFVNGVKLNPGQEIALHDGDKITAADEEFVYRAQ